MHLESNAMISAFPFATWGSGQSPLLGRRVEKFCPRNAHTSVLLLGRCWKHRKVAMQAIHTPNSENFVF